MDYESMRAMADSLITDFSNGQKAVLLKGEKEKDATGRTTVKFREVDNGLQITMTKKEEKLGKAVRAFLVQLNILIKMEEK